MPAPGFAVFLGLRRCVFRLLSEKTRFVGFQILDTEFLKWYIKIFDLKNFAKANFFVKTYPKSSKTLSPDPGSGGFTGLMGPGEPVLGSGDRVLGSGPPGGVFLFPLLRRRG